MANKSGRPKLPGNRYASGDRKPQITVNQVRRGILAAKELGHDEWLGSELGRLASYPVNGGAPLITPEQCAAGLAFARLFQSYSAEMGFPRRAPAACALERTARGEGSSETTKRTSGVLAAYRSAAAKLADVGALAIVVSVCVDDNALPWWQRARFVAGLNALARR